MVGKGNKIYLRGIILLFLDNGRFLFFIDFVEVFFRFFGIIVLWKLSDL